MNQTHNIADKPNILKVNRLLRKNKIEVVVDHQDQSDIVAYTDRKNRKIIINENNIYSQNNRYYVLAYMLGHFTEHVHDYRITVDCFDPIKSNVNQEQSEAHNFAMQTLMPKGQVLRHGKQVLESYLSKFNNKMKSNLFLSLMSQAFEVPSDWMKIRLQEFGVLTR